jgi:hypothetical protein
MHERCLKVVASIPTFALVDETQTLLLPLWIELETLLISKEEGKCLKVASIATFNCNFCSPCFELEIETLLISKEEIKKTIEAAGC